MGMVAPKDEVQKRAPAIARLSLPKAQTFRLVQAKQLSEYEQRWRELSDTSIVPNAFYEPWTLLPALEHLAAKQDLHFLLIFGPTRKNGTEPLWGFFPLHIQNSYLGLPVKVMAFWQHIYCFLTVPLIDQSHALEVLEMFWNWFESNPFSCKLLDTNLFLAEGPLHPIWTDFLIGRYAATLSEYPRAFFTPQGTVEAYLLSAVRKKHYDEFLRLERRFSEQGRLEYHQVETINEMDSFIDDFLRLEASGWKGRPGGGAFALDQRDASYLRNIIRNGFLERRVKLLTLSFNGKVVAMKFNLMTGDGGFTFKIAFDEEYSKYSPGLLLELENIRRAFNDPEIHWLDSCALARHPMADRIWKERRMIRQSLISDNSRAGNFWISAFPLLRWVKKQFKSQPTPSHLKISTQKGNS